MAVRQTPVTWLEAWKWARTAALPTTAAFTIMGWFYFGSAQLFNGYGFDLFIWQSLAGDIFTGNCSYWWVGTTSANPGLDPEKLWLQTYDGAVTNDAFGAVLPLEKWYHLAMVKSGNNFTLYLSDEAHTYDCVATATLTSAITFALAQVGPIANRANGIVNVKLWTEALTPALIRPERDSFAVSHLANLYSQSRFNIPGDYTDISGNGRDWTLSKEYAAQNPLALQPFPNPLVLGPLNASFATAQDLGSSLPVTITARADLGGVTQSLYYRYTAGLTDKVIGFVALGDLVVYKPTTTVYVGSVDDHNVYIDTLNSPLVATDLPLAFPVDPGATYFFEMAPNSGNPTPANLSLTLQRAPDAQQVQPGQVLIMDDQVRFPAVVLDQATGAVLKYIPNFATGEVACIFADGSIAAIDSGLNQLKWYDGNLNQFLLINGPLGTEHNPRAGGCDMASLFYVSANNNPVRIFTKGGVQSQITIPGLIGLEFVASLAPDRSNAILYYAVRTLGSGMRRFDLVNQVAMADLPNSTFAGQRISDTCILVLSNGNIVAIYQDGALAPATSLFVRVFSPAGVIQATYTLLGTISMTFIRMGAAFLDSPATVWITHRDVLGPSGYMRHWNLRLSDGAFLNNTPYTVPIFERGIWEGAPPIAAPPSFGRSESCPVLVLNPPAPPPAPCPGIT